MTPLLVDRLGAFLWSEPAPSPGGPPVGVLRELLAAALPDPAELLRLDRAPNGKPRLPHPSALEYSVARSGGITAAAVSRLGPVGIDLQAMAPGDTLLGALDVVAMPEEVRALSLTPLWRRRATALRSWVRKEACAKAIGLGIAAEPAAMAFARPADVATAAGTAGVRVGACTVWDLPAPRGFAAALALLDAPDDLRPRIPRWPTPVAGVGLPRGIQQLLVL